MNTLVDTLAMIEADSFMQNSASCAGRVTCQHDAIQPTRDRGQKELSTLYAIRTVRHQLTRWFTGREVNADKGGKTLTDVIGGALVC